MRILPLLSIMGHNHLHFILFLFSLLSLFSTTSPPSNSTINFFCYCVYVCGPQVLFIKLDQVEYVWNVLQQWLMQDKPMIRGPALWAQPIYFLVLFLFSGVYLWFSFKVIMVDVLILAINVFGRSRLVLGLFSFLI
eukprot:TRINITY_DN3653_c1_g1_i1.p1 TRINITY_DN3653_c1_g1~~TRINITY_DN3653_c1_g1_i1.p1  ORF type:complete len:136 (-),score=6.33 TRINITY_DN3653_c1_g1_i1:1245-1652(-)